jgi:Ca2+-binding EF-hand superfamily protein
MSVILNSYKGINFYNKDILFGMTQKDVKKILEEDAPKIEIDNIMEEVREYRSGMILIYKNKELIDITFTLNVNLWINNIEVFNNENFLDEISKFDNPTPEGKNGYINFYDLGISIGGFGKRKIPEKKLVSAFSKNRIKFYEFFLKM